VLVRAVQLLIIAITLVSWEFIPKIPGISKKVSFLNPFFISSPSQIGRQFTYLVTGSKGSVTIWGPFAETIGTALIATFIALIIGAMGGIAVANWGVLASITQPFLVVLNAVPKVAVIPIIILLVQSARLAAGVTAFIAVFFLAFYNSAEGAASVPREMIQNAQLLGASKVRIMLKVRSPYAVGWTLAALPNAIAFGLTATVTAEIITGGAGLGYQLLLAMNYSNATLLFSIVIIVSVVGVALVLGATALRKVLLPWWESSGAM
jgi:NitT/TauT family transport system permease protein